MQPTRRSSASELSFDFSPGSALYAELARITPAGKVPVLVEDDGFSVWATLAITEYIADVHPEQPVWPKDAQVRAARVACAPRCMPASCGCAASAR
jgi:glutathione S-transferase